jgi:hypothetical protein
MTPDHNGNMVSIPIAKDGDDAFLPQDSPLFSHSFSLWQEHVQSGKGTLNHGTWRAVCPDESRNATATPIFSHY